MSKMRDEIREQPAVLERTLAAERGPIEELRKVLERDPPRLIMLAARGTSDNAAQFGRYLLGMTTGTPLTLGARSRMAPPGAYTGTRHRSPRRALSLHGARHRAGPRLELRQRVRVCVEV